MATGSVSVRRAAPADVDAIGEAHAEAWRVGYVEIFDPAFLSAAVEGRRTGWNELLPTLLIEPNVLLVGELEGRAVAFGHAAPQDEPRTAEVCGFYCHPDAWGSGVAAALMAEILVVLTPDFDRVVLWTFRDAGRARRFYEKVGFAETGGERPETLTDWSRGASASRPAVEYSMSPLRPG